MRDGDSDMKQDALACLKVDLIFGVNGVRGQVGAVSAAIIDRCLRMLSALVTSMPMASALSPRSRMAATA